MIHLLVPRGRGLVLLLLAVPLVSIPILLRSTSPHIEYALPESVLADYTSPATHCFWPDSAAGPSSGTSSDGPQSSQKDRGGSAAGRIKDWIGWNDNVDDVDEDVEEMLETPEAKGFIWDGQLPDVIPVTGIERYMLAHIEELQQAYNATHDYEEYGLKLGNISLAAYTAELLSTYRNYLLPPDPLNTPNTYLPPVLSRLSLRPPIAPLPPRPDQVMTTDKSVDDLPWEFARWKEIMPEWEIKYFDDAALKAWVNGMFGGSKAEKIWNTLPRQVLKTDVFRYMAMLVEGGIYTDSDTAPIVHADLWGHPYEAGTPPLLTHLSRLLSLSTSPHLPSSHPLSSFSPDHASHTLEDGVDLPSGKSLVYEGPIVDDGSELGQPSLVVSVESDAIEFGWTNWREVGLSRAVQITQWTFMARPGHPVFLDALGRTLRKSEEMAQLKKAAKDNGGEFIPETALEWTGPGVFSDCVYRYLLARYGFRPEELIHQKRPIRVGDVLILPAGSYSSVSPFGDEQQRDWAASFHGFFGRWRDADPGVQEFERLKKIKEEAEEAEKQAQEEVNEKASQEAEEAYNKAQEAGDRIQENGGGTGELDQGVGKRGWEGD